MKITEEHLKEPTNIEELQELLDDYIIQTAGRTEEFTEEEEENILSFRKMISNSKVYQEFAQKHFSKVFDDFRKKIDDYGIKDVSYDNQKNIIIIESENGQTLRQDGLDVEILLNKYSDIPEDQHSIGYYFILTEKNFLILQAHEALLKLPND